MSLVRAILVPWSVLAGDPPTRLFDLLYVFPSGVVSTRLADSDRVIVFDDLYAVATAIDTPVEVFDVWMSGELEVDKVPCLKCRVEHPELDGCPYVRRAPAARRAPAR